MKVSELVGERLDYWVAQAEGIPADSPLRSMAVAVGSLGSYYPRYSSDWADGGPIIERELLTVVFDFQWKNWRSAWSLETGGFGQQYGSTPLEAAMRAYVASKFGDEVRSS